MMRLSLILGAALAATPLLADATGPYSHVTADRLADLAWSEGPLTLTLTGRLSNVVLVFDDGVSTYARYGDNGGSPSLLNLDADYAASSALTLGFVYEANYAYNGSGIANQRERFLSPGGVDHRKLELTLTHDRLGTLSLGQGSLAGDGVFESDLSGTANAGYSAIGDHGGGFYLRDAATGDLSPLTIGTAMPSLDGGRAVRARYDTPTFGSGFTLSVSQSTETTLAPSDDVPSSTQVALSYLSPEGTAPFGNPAIRQVQASFGYLSFDTPRDRNVIGGSVSVLTVGGWNATVAGGVRDEDDRTDAGYVYGKAGWRGDVFELGETALSTDLYVGFDTAEGIDRSYALGLQAAQQIDGSAVEVFAAIRHYWTEGPRDLRDATMGLGGFLIRF
ncbi:hypothetical protein OCGS_1058 [Oceaniovalibus guishaninsula JLT2003]|uniref:Porin domain-containing protein n=1 Tax=Oceaniovalibus guishaninsula JLT2003 TaxID=1231392 RepID=K2I727_9RHOB|nr:hypothetical protein [Oceaniovalibus guishaninsula]EKE44825.1 hypothetical protein OCGS_1058 [Oceaniovalibus guishaninsula JLT2003]